MRCLTLFLILGIMSYTSCFVVDKDMLGDLTEENEDDDIEFFQQIDEPDPGEEEGGEEEYDLDATEAEEDNELADESMNDIEEGEEDDSEEEESESDEDELAYEDNEEYDGEEEDERVAAENYEEEGADEEWVEGEQEEDQQEEEENDMSNEEDSEAEESDVEYEEDEDSSEEEDMEVFDEEDIYENNEEAETNIEEDEYGQFVEDEMEDDTEEDESDGVDAEIIDDTDALEVEGNEKESGKDVAPDIEGTKEIEKESDDNHKRVENSDDVVEKDNGIENAKEPIDSEEDTLPENNNGTPEAQDEEAGDKTSVNDDVELEVLGDSKKSKNTEEEDTKVNSGLDVDSLGEKYDKLDGEGKDSLETQLYKTGGSNPNEAGLIEKPIEDIGVGKLMQEASTETLPNVDEKSNLSKEKEEQIKPGLKDENTEDTGIPLKKKENEETVLLNAEQLKASYEEMDALLGDGFPNKQQLKSANKELIPPVQEGESKTGPEKFEVPVTAEIITENGKQRIFQKALATADEEPGLMIEEELTDDSKNIDLHVFNRTEMKNGASLKQGDFDETGTIDSNDNDAEAEENSDPPAALTIDVETAEDLKNEDTEDDLNGVSKLKDKSMRTPKKVRKGKEMSKVKKSKTTGIQKKKKQVKETSPGNELKKDVKKKTAGVRKVKPDGKAPPKKAFSAKKKSTNTDSKKVTKKKKSQTDSPPVEILPVAEEIIPKSVVGEDITLKIKEDEAKLSPLDDDLILDGIDKDVAATDSINLNDILTTDSITSDDGSEDNAGETVQEETKDGVEEAGNVEVPENMEESINVQEPINVEEILTKKEESSDKVEVVTSKEKSGNEVEELTKSEEKSGENVKDTVTSEDDAPKSISAEEIEEKKIEIFSDHNLDFIDFSAEDIVQKTHDVARAETDKEDVEGKDQGGLKEQVGDSLSLDENSATLAQKENFAENEVFILLPPLPQEDNDDELEDILPKPSEESYTTGDKHDNGHVDSCASQSPFMELHSQSPNKDSCASDKPSEKEREKYKENISKIINMLDKRKHEHEAKIQTLEVQLLRIENQILSDTLNSSTKAASLSKLENIILKLENELLRLNQSFHSVKVENDKLKQNQQNQANDIALVKEDHQRTYPVEHDFVSEMNDILNKQQTKIKKLVDMVKNQESLMDRIDERALQMERRNHELQMQLMNQSLITAQLMSRIEGLVQSQEQQKTIIDTLNKEVTLVKNSQPDRNVQNAKNENYEKPQSNKDQAEEKGNDGTVGKNNPLDEIQKLIPEDDVKPKTDIQHKQKPAEKIGKDAPTPGDKQPPKPIYLDEDYKQPKDCFDLFMDGRKRDTVANIRPKGAGADISVWCDMKNGGWTIIQRRVDGRTDFFRDWKDYKTGFGDKMGEHWLGLDNIHTITNQNYYSLRVDIMDWDRNEARADYTAFLVQDEASGYQLYISGYHGNAGGDGFVSGLKFSTKDVDNDLAEKDFGGSCANRFHGAWWYHKCYKSNLNGKYYKGGQVAENAFDGVSWKPWKGPKYSMKKVEIKIRPKNAAEKLTKT